MADRLRREKDIIKRNIDSYINATTSQYSAYYEGSPSYITYYQVDKEASKEDIGLEAVNSLTGSNAPTKYRKIYDVVIYGIDALDISNEISERGLQSNVSGEFVLRPDSIKPNPGDFFTFDYEGMEEHLFKINDVQFDKITPKKYYRCAFSLYPYNNDDIIDNISGEYTLDYDNIGGELSAVVEKASAASTENTQVLVDELIEKFEKMFYDEDMDTFVYRDINGINYWSPYLQHFLHDTKALDRYNRELLTEIYIGDISEQEFPSIYSEKLYRESLFRIVQTKDLRLLRSDKLDQSFLAIHSENLKEIRNLPFFNSPLEYKVIRPVNDIDGTGLDYANAFFPFFEESLQLFRDVDHYHKVHILDDVHLNEEGREEHINIGDIIYECRRHELEPTRVCMATNAVDSKTGEAYTEIRGISLSEMMKDDYEFEGIYLFYIIKAYLQDKLKLTDEILDKLHDYYYEPTIQSYILMPLAIYALKQSIK